jgi:hypothetical protein
MSAASKQVYIMVAKAIKASDIDGIDRALLVDKLCIEFKTDNSRFNRELFTKACQPKVEPIGPLLGNNNDEELTTLCSCASCEAER